MSEAGVEPEVEDGEGTTTTGGETDGGLLGSEPDWPPAALSAVREDTRQRAIALVATVVVGLALSWVHWLGLFAAGALVGLVSRTLPRAVLAGLAVGVLVLVATVLASPVMEVGEFVGLTPPVYVAVAAALAAPAWGSLVRGVV